MIIVLFSLRQLYDPPLDNSSIGHADDYCPGIDVHHSSGVFNKVFYLLSTMEIVEHWDIFAAFSLFLEANR